MGETVGDHNPIAPIRVVLVDDQELVRTGFRLILESHDDLTVVGEAANGVSAVELVRTSQPDIVIMDIRMPEMDGVEATRQIMAAPGGAGACKVIVVTTFDLDEYVFSALSYGAAGFLLKDAPAEQLVEAIRVVHAGKALLSPSVTRTIIDRFKNTKNPGRIEHHKAHRLEDLTERETDVFTQMAHGLSNGEIAEALFVSEATVKTHVGHILTKLDLRDRVQAVVLAYESGWIGQ